MSLTKREKATLLVGAAGVVLMVIVPRVVAPAWANWQRMGVKLDVAYAQLQNLDDVAARQKDLVAQRNRLARTLGTLVGAPPADAKAPAGAPPAAAPGAAPAKAAAVTSAATVKAATATSAAPGASLAAKVGAPKAAAPGDPPPADTAAKAPAAPGTANTSVAKNPGTADPPAKDAAAKPAPAVAAVPLETHMERTAMQAGIKIKRLAPQRAPRDVPSGPYYQSVLLQVSYEGNIESLVKWLYALEKGDRVVRIQDLKMNRDPKKGMAVDGTLDVIGYSAGASKS